MAENSPNLNTVRTQKTGTSTFSTHKGADALAITFEVEHSLDEFSESLRDLVYGDKYGTEKSMASANEGMFTVIFWWWVEGKINTKRPYFTYKHERKPPIYTVLWTVHVWLAACLVLVQLMPLQ